MSHSRLSARLYAAQTAERRARAAFRKLKVLSAVVVDYERGRLNDHHAFLDKHRDVLIGRLVRHAHQLTIYL